MPAQLGEEAAITGPHHRACVLAGRDDELAIRRERRGVHAILVGQHGAHLLPAGSVPDIRLPIPSGHDPPAVGAEVGARQVEPWVAVELQKATAPRAPQVGGVFGAQYNATAVGAELHESHGGSQGPRKRPARNLPAGPGIPHASRAALVAGRDPAPVSAERYGGQPLVTDAERPAGAATPDQRSPRLGRGHNPVGAAAECHFRRI